MNKSIKLFRLACPLICSVSMLSFSVYADEDELGTISLEDLLNVEVVSATRSESKLSESPVPISVITASEIASSGLDNIPDILARLPEIDIIRVGASQTEVSIRGKGINFNRRLLTMIDGRSEYNDLFGVTLWHAFPIAVDDIERIEVVRGPASALFGANAYSGVINIITKQADSEGENLFRAHAGTNGKIYANGQFRYSEKKLSFKASVTGQNMQNEDSDVMYPGFNRFNTSSNFIADDESLDNIVRFNSQLIYKNSKSMEMRFAAGMNKGTYELLQQPGLPRSKWDIDTSYLHFIGNYHFENGVSLEFNTYANKFKYQTDLLPLTSQLNELALTDGHRYFPSFDQAFTFDGKVDTTDIDLQFVGKALEDQINWVAGVEYRRIENAGGLATDSNKSINSIFSNFTYRFTKWQLGAGFRLDDDSITGNDSGYTLSLSHYFNQTDSLRLTARRAFRAPSLFEQFSQIDLNVPFQNQRVRFRGNTSLAVETIDSVDLTYTMQLGNSTQVSLEVYHEEYMDIIGNPDSGILDDVVLDPETNTFVTTTSFQNLADASSNGFQASVIWLASDRLNLYANYAYANPDALNSVPGETFFTPESKVNLGGLWKASEQLSVDFSLNYVAKTDDDEFVSGNVSPEGPNFTKDNQEAYTSVNFSINYQPHWTDNLSFYLSGQNIFDDEHVEYYEYDQVLRTAGESFGNEFWGGFSWQF